MKVARHWVRESANVRDARGDVHRGEGWGWSETSVEEARRRAKEVAQRVAQWLADHGKAPEPPRSWQYTYTLGRPPREEIVQELRDMRGEVSAFITRNGYGALVLNARDLMFVDIDFPRPKIALAGLLKRLFRKAPPPANVEDEIAERVQNWCADNRDRGVRLYRTAAGFRLVLTDRPMQAHSAETRHILEALGSDPLYRHLCEAQECFRARLTPKPWRMGAVKQLGNPPAKFPFEDADAEQRYRQWQREYDETAPRFATCRLVKASGPREIHPDLAPLVKLHDSLTNCEHPLQLA